MKNKIIAALMQHYGMQSPAILLFQAMTADGCEPVAAYKVVFEYEDH
jgi:hypothetical protein